VVNLANPLDEDGGLAHAISHSGVMTGVARLAVHELSDTLLPGVGRPSSPFNSATLLLRLKKGEEMRSLLSVSRNAYDALKEKSMRGELDRTHHERIRLAIDQGDRAALRRALLD